MQYFFYTDKLNFGWRTETQYQFGKHLTIANKVSAMVKWLYRIVITLFKLTVFINLSEYTYVCIMIN